MTDIMTPTAGLDTDQGGLPRGVSPVGDSMERQLMTQPEDPWITHLALFSRAAERSGADVPALMRDKILSRDDLEALVDCCTTCGGVRGCRSVMEREAAGAPDFCPNLQALAELSRSRPHRS
jgi:hypothetical protein